MEAINKKCWKLKVAEYQPVRYWGNNTMSIQRVFNQKRRYIGIAAPRYPDMRTSLLNELKTNRLLTNINLSNNSLGDKGAKYIAEGIRVSASLTRLILQNNNLGPAGAQHLSEALKINKSITELDISNGRGSSSGNIKAEGAKYIAEMLNVNASLTQVLAFYKLSPSLSHPLTAVVLLLA